MSVGRLRASIGVLAAVLLSAILPTAAQATPVTWVNETNVAGEADFAILQFPPTLTQTAGTLTANVFGQVFETGVTSSAGASASVLADVGYGTAGSDPRTDSS